MAFCSDKTIAMGERLKPPRDETEDGSCRLCPRASMLRWSAPASSACRSPGGLRAAACPSPCSTAPEPAGDEPRGHRHARGGRGARARRRRLADACDREPEAWPRVSLRARSGIGPAIDYRDDGTLVVALGRDEVERLRFRYEHQRRSGLDTRWLSGTEVRPLEPGLRPSMPPVSPAPATTRSIRARDSGAGARAARAADSCSRLPGRRSKCPADGFPAWLRPGPCRARR